MFTRHEIIAFACVVGLAILAAVIAFNRTPEAGQNDAPNPMD